MKICMLIRTMPAHGRGGMEDHAFTLAKTLVKKGHTVTVVTTNHPTGLAYEKTEGVDIFYLDRTRKRDYFLGWWKRSSEAVVGLHGRKRFDVIHSQGVAAYGIFKNGINRKLGIPVVLSLHGTSIDEIRSKVNIGFSLTHPGIALRNLGSLLKFTYFYFVLEKVCLKEADIVIATSREQLGIITKYHGVDEEKIKLVYNGIDCELFSMPKSGEARTKLSMLAVARLVGDKGVEYIIRAMPAILRAFPAARLEIVGDGRMRRSLEDLTKDLDLEKCVKFHGYVEYARLPEFYRKAAVFANPTIRIDGYDLTILQAMAAGCPVVTSNIGSIPTVARDKVNSLLLPPKDVKGLEDAVLSLLADKALRDRLTEAAHKDVAERFSLDSMAAGTEEAYITAKRT